MICAYLYQSETNELNFLNGTELMECAPTAEEVAQRRMASNGGAPAGRPRCHAGEMMWVDVTNPSIEDFAMLRQRFQLHPMVIEDIQAKEGRPKLHTYSEYLYIIFHALRRAEGWKPAGASTSDTSTSDTSTSVAGLPDEAAAPNEVARPERLELHLCEIDCLVGADYVVTIHTDPLQAFDDLRDRWLRRPDMMQAGASHLLYEIMDEVLDDYFPFLDALDERIDAFEDRLYLHFQEGLSGEIFALKRSLLQLRRVAAPTRDVVNTLLRHDAETGGKHFIYFQDLYDHAVRIVDNIDTFRDILSGALDAYLALQSNRMNSVMKTLTSASIMLLVPALIAGIYGMNFEHMPELKSPYGYYIALGVMVTCVLSLFAVFKRKGWL